MSEITMTPPIFTHSKRFCPAANAIFVTTTTTKTSAQTPSPPTSSFGHWKIGKGGKVREVRGEKSEGWPGNGEGIFQSTAKPSELFISAFAERSHVTAAEQDGGLISAVDDHQPRRTDGPHPQPPTPSGAPWPLSKNYIPSS